MWCGCQEQTNVTQEPQQFFIQNSRERAPLYACWERQFTPGRLGVSSSSVMKLATSGGGQQCVGAQVGQREGEEAVGSKVTARTLNSGSCTHSGSCISVQLSYYCLPWKTQSSTWVIHWVLSTLPTPLARSERILCHQHYCMVPAEKAQKTSQWAGCPNTAASAL